MGNLKEMAEQLWVEAYKQGLVLETISFDVRDTNSGGAMLLGVDITTSLKNTNYQEGGDE